MSLGVREYLQSAIGGWASSCRWRTTEARGRIAAWVSKCREPSLLAPMS